jgi:surface protein
MSNLLEKASILLTPTAYDDGKVLSVKPEDGTGDFDFTRNSSATRVNSQGLIEDVQILSSNLVSNGDFSQEGSELITNGDFSNGSTDWTLGTGWSIGDDIATSDGVSSNSNLATSSRFYSGSIPVKMTINVTDFVSGTLKVFLSSINFTNITANGDYVFYTTADRADGKMYLKSVNFNGSVTNVSVKEVGQDWTLGTGWSIGDDIANASGSANANISQNSFLTIGNKYKVTYTVLNASTGARVGLAPNGSTVQNIRTENGTYTEVYEAVNTSFYIRNLWNNDVGLSVSNISVVEITEDTNLPRINYEGFSYQDALGSELVVNGDFATDSNWFKDANWTIANGKATSTGGGRMFQSIPFLETNIGTTVKVSFDIIDVTANGVVVNCYGGVSQLFTTVGTHTFTTTTTNNTNLYFNNAGAGNLIGSIDNVSVKEVLGQEVVPDSGCGSWLFEPQSTNLIITSDSGVYGSSPASGILTTAPDGTNTAVRPVPNTGSNRYTGQISGGIYATNTKITYSWYRKRISTPVIDTYVGDLQPNILVNVTQVGSTIQIKSDINGFDRFSATFNITDGSLASNIRLYFGAIIGTGNSSIAYWGHQLEVGSYATSIIPTSGSTVTRLQDAAFGSGSSDLINSTEGVLYAEIAALSDSVSFFLGVYGSSNSRVRLTFGPSSIKGQVFNGSYQCRISSVQTISNNNKIALKYKQDDFALWINGVEVGTDTSGLTFSADTLTYLNLSAYDETSNRVQGKVKCVAVFKEALTDAELTCLTTDAELEFLTTDETSYSSSTALAPEAVSYYYYSGDGSGQSNLELNNEGLPILDDSNIQAAVNAYLNGELEDIELWDVSNVTSIYRLFQDATEFNQDISNWDVSNVTNVGFMFYNATSFNQPIGNWDITNITSEYNGYFMPGVTLSAANYDNLLIGWAAKMLVAYPGGSGYSISPSWNFGNSVHTIGGDAETAKNTLVNTFNWTITDAN